MTTPVAAQCLVNAPSNLLGKVRAEVYREHLSGKYSTEVFGNVRYGPQHPTEFFGMVGYELDTRTRHFGQFDTPTKNTPVPVYPT